MKNLKHIFVTGLIGFCCTVAPTLLVSCGEDDLDGTSVVKDSPRAQTAFDKWLDANYVKPYNITLKYRLEDYETDFAYTLVPADINNSIKLAHIVLHTWLKAYDEVAGKDFTRRMAPKMFQFVGSPAMISDYRYIMGQAESGMKITLYDVNNLKIDKTSLVNSYFQSMHHEFIHILTQNVPYNTDFQKISEGSYEPGEWYNSGKTETYALEKGFISTYAMSEYNEDFAETLAFYLVFTPTEWQQKLSIAGTTGSPYILEKLQMIRSYMQSVWNIDIDDLRTVILRRMDEVAGGTVDLESLE